MPIRALCFDVFGTLVDWRSSLIEIGLDVGRGVGVDANWAAIVDDWRRSYAPALARVRETATWRDLDEVQAETLVAVLDNHRVQLPEPQQALLVRSWRRLRPWPDTQHGLERLRSRFVTATLSNGHVALLIDLLRFGDLRVDAVLSSQLADSYKPDPAVYLRAADLLECSPSEVAMVAAHGSDLEAAADLGLRPVFVRRPDEWGAAASSVPAEPPTGLAGLVVADGLEDLADQFGC